MGIVERMLKRLGIWDPEESGWTRSCSWCELLATRIVNLTGPGGEVLDVAHCDAHQPQASEHVDQWLDQVGYGARTQRSA